jgi:esterase/lipase superfamily enzyme
MTLFLDFRTSGVGGDILDAPRVLEGDGLVAAPELRPLGRTLPADRIAGREVVFATHGFNVSRAAGVHALARLEQDLKLPPAFVLVGVLWPGDWWIPVVNYPAEAGDAVRCGRALADFVNTSLSAAASVSFVSHSLGGRLVLEAVKRLARPAREVCVVAAAVDDDCLITPQYDGARRNARRISVLASKGDRVLRLAYPAGDFLSDLFFRDDDSAVRGALGYHGPRRRAELVLHAQIPDGARYDHGDYFPPSDLTLPVGKQGRPEAFIAETLLGSPHAWP